MAQTQLITHLVQVVLDRRGKSIGIRGIHLAARLADDVAVEVAHGLTDCDGNDDEGDEKERVGACHDEEAEIGFGPVVGDADEDVEGCDAGLGLLGILGSMCMCEVELTMLMVPTNSLGGSTPRLTMLPMKLEVMPTMTTIEMTCKMRTSRKVLLKGIAP